MSPNGGVGVVLCIFVLGLCISDAQEILKPPENQTVFLDQSAVFTCETKGGFSGWRVNGSLLEELPPDIRRETTTADGRTVEKLIIPARSEYNGTKVQCIAYGSGGAPAESTNVTLQVQGLLSAVANFTVTNNATSYKLSWTAPSSLNVTGVDPDIWYSVLINNVTDENNPTAILCTDCINITETHYTFTPDNLSPCHVYNFSVIPVNGAGQGESSPLVTGYILNPSELPKPEIVALSKKEFQVTFETLGNYASGCRYNITPVSVGGCIHRRQEGTLLLFDLCANKEYSFLVSTTNVTGKVLTALINISTFDVQNADARTKDSGSIRVNGELVTNTTAKGIFIVFQGEDGSPDVFRAAFRRDGSSTVTSVINSVPPSTYTVFVYDLEEDGLPATTPSLELNNTVQVEGKEEPVTAESTAATIRSNGTAITVVCQDSSCVLVGREYGSITLLVDTISDTMVKPIDKSGNYTFSVFMMHNISEEPVVTERFEIQPTKTDPDEEESTLLTVLVVVAVVGFCILIIPSGVALLWQVKRWRKKHHDTNDNYYLMAVSSNFYGTPVAANHDTHRECNTTTLPISHQIVDNGKHTIYVASSAGKKTLFPVFSMVQYQEIDIKNAQIMAQSPDADMEHDMKTTDPDVLPNDSQLESNGTNREVAAVHDSSRGACAVVVGGPSKTSSVTDREINEEADNLGAEQDDAGPEISDPEQQNLVFVNNEQEKGYDNENMETVISVGSLEAERSQDSGPEKDSTEAKTEMAEVYDNKLDGSEVVCGPENNIINIKLNTEMNETAKNVIDAQPAECDTPPQGTQKKEKDKKIHDDSGVMSCSRDLKSVEAASCPSELSSVEDPDDLSSTEVEDNKSGFDKPCVPQENLSEPTPTAQPVDDSSDGDEIETGVQQMNAHPGNSGGRFEELRGLIQGREVHTSGTASGYNLSSTSHSSWKRAKDLID